MLIEIKDLKVGDEIIVSSNSRLKYLKVLRNPSLGKRINPYTGALLYKGLMCSSRREEVEYKYYNNPTRRTWKKKEYKCTPDEHNIEKYENLNYKTMWLVKRGNQ